VESRTLLLCDGRGHAEALGQASLQRWRGRGRGGETHAGRLGVAEGDAAHDSGGVTASGTRATHGGASSRRQAAGGRGADLELRLLLLVMLMMAAMVTHDSV